MSEWEPPRLKTDYQRLVQGVLQRASARIREPHAVRLGRLGHDLWATGTRRHVFARPGGGDVPVDGRWYFESVGWDIVGVKGRLGGAGRVRWTEFYIAPGDFSSAEINLYEQLRRKRVGPADAARLTPGLLELDHDVAVLAELAVTLDPGQHGPDEVLRIARRVLR